MTDRGIRPLQCHSIDFCQLACVTGLHGCRPSPGRESFHECLYREWRACPLAVSSRRDFCALNVASVLSSMHFEQQFAPFFPRCSSPLCVTCVDWYTWSMSQGESRMRGWPLPLCISAMGRPRNRIFCKNKTDNLRAIVFAEHNVRFFFSLPPN